MNLMIVMLAILSALALTGAAVSLFALRRAHGLLQEVERRKVEAPPAAVVDTAKDVREAVASLAAQVHELQKAGAVTLDPAIPRPAMNLSKRSQALRLHRRGESTEQIASEMQLPRQEVDLLLKVHRIVLSTV
jgi:DNA-binding NarL/FixJ family response regulator